MTMEAWLRDGRNYFAAADCVQQLRMLHTPNPDTRKKYPLCSSDGHKNYFIVGGGYGKIEPYIIVHLNRHVYSCVVSGGLDRMIEEIKYKEGIASAKPEQAKEKIK